MHTPTPENHIPFADVAVGAHRAIHLREMHIHSFGLHFFGRLVPDGPNLLAVPAPWRIKVQQPRAGLARECRVKVFIRELGRLRIAGECVHSMRYCILECGCVC